MMTVRELIEKLSEITDQDHPVWIGICDRCAQTKDIAEVYESPSHGVYIEVEPGVNRLCDCNFKGKRVYGPVNNSNK